MPMFTYKESSLGGVRCRRNHCDFICGFSICSDQIFIDTIDLYFKKRLPFSIRFFCSNNTFPFWSGILWNKHRLHIRYKYNSMQYVQAHSMKIIYNSFPRVVSLLATWWSSSLSFSVVVYTHGPRLLTYLICSKKGIVIKHFIIPRLDAMINW